jgi:hypothetical protein
VIPEEERSAITAATHRLLSGKPLRSSGALDIVTLAAEAGLKRNKLTHKRKDLKDLFYAEVRAHNGAPASEIKLREEAAALKARIGSLPRNAITTVRRARRSPGPSMCSPSRTTTSARMPGSDSRPQSGR